MTFEHEPAPPLPSKGPTPGDYYLAGFVDAYHRRPAAVQATKRAQAAYAKGYAAGRAARKARK